MRVKKTEGVKQLVREALDSLQTPHSEDVIDDVAYAIETHPRWLQRYEDLCHELTKTVTNNWIGVHTKSFVGGMTVQQVAARKSSILESYTKLDTLGKKT